jgi:hypothetical protein
MTKEKIDITGTLLVAAFIISAALNVYQFTDDQLAKDDASFYKEQADSKSRIISNLKTKGADTIWRTIDHISVKPVIRYREVPTFWWNVPDSVDSTERLPFSTWEDPDASFSIGDYVLRSYPKTPTPDVDPHWDKIVVAPYPNRDYHTFPPSPTSQLDLSDDSDTLTTEQLEYRNGMLFKADTLPEADYELKVREHLQTLRKKDQKKVYKLMHQVEQRLERVAEIMKLK